MAYKLIAFDLVGTLTEQDALYRRIHELKNCKAKAKQNVQLYLERKISEKELITRNVFYHKGIPIEIMKIEARKLEFRQGAEELINNLKNKYVLALITSDYDIAAQFVKEKLGFKYAFGCKEKFDKNKGFEKCSEIIDGKAKLRKLELIAQKENIKLSEIIYIGNDVNDIFILEKVGYSIAFNASEEVRETASTYCDRENMRDILPVIEKLQ